MDCDGETNYLLHLLEEGRSHDQVSTNITTNLWVNIVRTSTSKSYTTDFQYYSPPSDVTHRFGLYIICLIYMTCCCGCTSAKQIVKSIYYKIAIDPWT